MHVTAISSIFRGRCIQQQLIVKAREALAGNTFQGLAHFNCLIGGLLIVLTFAIFSGATYAHDWYSGTRNAITGVGCCGGRDCRPIDAARVVETADAFIVDGRWRFNKNEVMPSRDGAYHACIWGGKPRCFFVPMNV